MAAASVLAAAGWFGFWRYHLKRFDEVRPGVLYRVAQPTEFGFRYVVDRYDVKTVLSVRLEDPPLYRGLLDPGMPNGAAESDFVRALGLEHRQWPLGEETYWPWVTPALFEEFFRLFDDPANLPVLVHCVGGRHRTGTLVALFQMEYNRLSPSEALREMYSYDFGPPVPLQEHNLRTYLPRPLPTAEQWAALVEGLYGRRTHQSDIPYRFADLVRRLKSAPPDGPMADQLVSYVSQGRPFALCLAQWLIDKPGHFLAPAATALAVRRITQDGPADAAELASAASLVADFGTPPQQQQLLAFLHDEPKTGRPSARYCAVVAGVTNRYTLNRIPYLAPLLVDVRERSEPDARGYRFCDTAVARLISITNEPLHVGAPTRNAWDQAVQRCHQWLVANPTSCRLCTLLPATGRNEVRRGTFQEVDGPIKR